MKPAFTFTLPAKLLLTTVILLKCSAVFAQNARFAFDRTGSLLIQTNDAISPPEIVGGPRSQIVAPGRTASFAVVAADTRNLTYQWRFNGTNVPAATGDTLLLTNVSAASEGLYSVVLVNGSGSVTSAAAMLWIDSDGDGLPDAWEQTYFGSLIRNPTGDFDGDGISNLDEFNDGTSPTNNASAQFRLTVMNNGGQVSVTPAKLSYTNGELVTVAVTAFPGETFHIWSGAVITRTDPVTLVMTNNKTLFAHFSPFTFSWTNSAGGDWHNPLNWNSHLVPSALDDVGPLPAVTITMNAFAECHGLTFAGGTLTGPGDMSIHGDAVWAGGTMSGTGRTIIEPGGTLTINNSFNIALNRTLENAGTVMWTGSALLTLNNGVITNRVGALFDVQNAATLNFGGTSRFDNAGTFRKSVNAGTALVAVPLNNYGTVETVTGTLSLNSGGSHTGNFDLTGGSTLAFGGGTHNLSVAASIVGAGNLTVSGATVFTHSGFANVTGTHTFSGGTASFSGNYICTNNALTVSGGTVNLSGTGAVTPATLNLNSTLAGSALVTVLQQMNWTGGTMSGTGRTLIEPGATLTINNSFNIALNRTLENAGAATWTGNALLALNSGVITNRVGALFDIQNVPTLNYSGTSRFDNAGTFRKSVNAGTALVSTPFNNYGAVDVQSGTLQCSVNFLNNGAVTAAAGTTYRMTAGGSASGTFNAAATALVEWTGGTFTLNPGAQLNGAGQYRITGGTLTCNTDSAVQLLDLSGTLNGSGALTISNAMSWTGGTMGGSGRTFIAPGATLTINSPFFTMVLDRTLENAGTVVWPGAPGLNLNAVITNRPGALFHVQNAATLSSGGGSPRFDNAGTFRKSSNSGTATINIPFNNSSTVELQTGTLHHNSSFVNNGSVTLAAATTHRMTAGGSSSGTFTNPSTALVEWTANTFTLNSGAQLNGSGAYRINGGALACNTDATVQNLDVPSGTLDGSGVVTISNTMTWSGGSLNGSGRTIIASGATMTINNPFFTINLNRTLENGGTVLWTGAAVYVNNVAITNRVGALFHVQTAPTFYNTGGSPRFDNAGTFRKSADTGTTTFNSGMSFNNYSAIDIQSGTLLCSGTFLNNGSVTLAAATTHRMTAGGSSSGTFTNPSTALVEWTGGTFTLNTGAQLNGDGLYRINGGALTCNPDTTVQKLDFLNGILDGPGVVTVSNAMTWTFGTMGGSGRTVIALGATLTINNSPYVILNRLLENGGTVLWTGSSYLNMINAVITNRPGALFHVQNAQPFYNGGGAPRFDNAGTFRKSGNSGITTFNSGVSLNNYGTVDLQSGTLLNNGGFLNSGSVTLAAATTHRMTGGGSSSGTFTNSATALVEWTGGTFTLNPGAQLNGDGLYRINGGALTCNPDTTVQKLDFLNGTLDGSGVVTVSNVMIWAAGTMGGSGRTVIAPGATLTMNNAIYLTLNRLLENGGTVVWTGSYLTLNNAVITNRPGALFHVQNAQIVYNGGGTPRIDNAGTFRKSANPGTATFNIPFNNYGTMDIRSGIVFVNANFVSASNAVLNCTLGGTTAGTGYGQLQKSGTITLDGALSVDLLPGFSPATNDTFAVVTAGTRSGVFANFSYPSNRVTLSLSNSPTSVILRATDVFPVPQPVLLTPEMAIPNVRLIWTATSNVTYRLEFNPALTNLTNWIAVPGDVTTLSNTASKLDPLTTSNRFYRVRVLP